MRKKIILKISGIACAFFGVGILIYVFYPILAYEVVSTIQFKTYLSPVPKDEELAKASNWFPNAPNNEDFNKPGNVRFYTLSVPSLKIKDATVAIGGEDLTQSLIQYPGTALPGKRGNAVIFGHSVLPQFFDPKNYLTIFSTLPRLKKNDEIEVDYDGISYKYLVENMFEVEPTDIQILEQNSVDSFLTLVTCVPPGNPLSPRRLVVRAKLIPQNEKLYYETDSS
jgi:sortase A